MFNIFKLSNRTVINPMKIKYSEKMKLDSIKVANFEFPPKNKLKFYNQVIGFVHKPGSKQGFNIIMT